MEAQLDPIFQAAIDAKTVPGVAGVAMDVSGKVLFSKGYGHTTFGDANSAKVTPQTSCVVFSCSKLVTCVAALQLVEQGKLNIQDPAKKYVPEIAKIQRLHGFHADGSPDLRPPEKDILVLHLFTHTAGFSYDFFDQDTLKYRIAAGETPCAYMSRNAREDFNTPLLFEPGSAYSYGISIDWLGFIVASISGLTLAEYADKHIIQPLGLKNMGVSLSEEQEKNFLTVCAKDVDGNLTPSPVKLPENPEVYGGGHFLYSSCEDYANFLVTIVNNGTHPITNVQILKPDTVRDYIFTDMIPAVGCSDKGIGDITASVPALSRTGTFLPGVKKGWSLGVMMANEQVPNGRRKTSGSWAGLGNSYYWMDPVAGKLGFVVSGILPFFDPDILHLVDALERAVYNKSMANAVGEDGSNFAGGEYMKES